MEDKILQVSKVFEKCAEYLKSLQERLNEYQKTFNEILPNLQAEIDTASLRELSRRFSNPEGSLDDSFVVVNKICQEYINEYLWNKLIVYSKGNGGAERKEFKSIKTSEISNIKEYLAYPLNIGYIQHRIKMAKELEYLAKTRSGDAAHVKDLMQLKNIFLRISKTFEPPLAGQIKRYSVCQALRDIASSDDLYNLGTIYIHKYMMEECNRVYFYPRAGGELISINPQAENVRNKLSRYFAFPNTDEYNNYRVKMCLKIMDYLDESISYTIDSLKLPVKYHNKFRRTEFITQYHTVGQTDDLIQVDK